MNEIHPDFSTTKSTCTSLAEIICASMSYKINSKTKSFDALQLFHPLSRNEILLKHKEFNFEQLFHKYIDPNFCVRPNFAALKDSKRQSRSAYAPLRRLSDALCATANRAYRCSGACN